MENMNKKVGQGKSPKQYEDSTRFAWYGVVGMIILLILASLLSSCTGVYYLTDSEYSDVRESHASLTYYDNQIYWGWDNGYYYYYGTPHYYPWYYYYNTCPPSHYTHTTHVVITRPVNRPHTIKHRPNNIIKTNTHRNTNVKTNVNRNKVIIKTNNSTKRSVKTRRNPR